MTEPRFVHLRLHSEYSVTDGLVRIDPAIHKTLEMGGVALGITDLMNVFGGLRFYTHALSAGLKPILGCDVKIKNNKFPDNPYRMTFYCMNHTGYHSLCVLLTKAFLEGQDPYRGQICDDWLDVPGATDGLIALTGGPKGRLSQLIDTGSERQAGGIVGRWKKLFPNRLYIELQRANRPKDENQNAFLVTVASRFDVPVVATHPVQFLEPQDFEAHEVRCCIAGGFTITDPRRDKSYTREQYLKSEEQMCELFKDVPSALANSVIIAKRCNLDGVLSKPQLPLFPTPDGMSLDDYMDHLSREGLEKRLAFLYDDEKVRDAKRPEYVERLDYELGIIKKMQFPGYFLIVQDFINWSKTHGVPVGPGRGSGAGSLVAYSLGITDLDPLKFDLLFERFLNPERVSMPDFDVDFCQYNRDRTIEYVKETYGADAVSQIATFGTLGAKAVVRDVARVLNVPFSKADRLAKLIPMQPGKNVTLDDAIKEVPEFREAIESDDEYKELMRVAKGLEGITRNLGMHAGGVLIAVSLFAADIYPTLTASFRYAMFQFVSVVTTTGFATAASNTWTSFAVILLIFGSIVCACAGSTAGGIKVNRLVLAGKMMRTRLRQQQHPNAIIRIRLDGVIQENEALHAVMIFIVTYLMFILAGTVFGTMLGVDLTTSFTGAVASMGNVGPGFGEVGSMDNFSAMPAAFKVSNSLLMLLGRLEIFGLIQIFFIKWWR